MVKRRALNVGGQDRRQSFDSGYGGSWKEEGGQGGFYDHDFEVAKAHAEEAVDRRRRTCFVMSRVIYVNIHQVLLIDSVWYQNIWSFSSFWGRSSGSATAAQFQPNSQPASSVELLGLISTTICSSCREVTSGLASSLVEVVEWLLSSDLVAAAVNSSISAVLSRVW